jgi:hyaluronan synthase
MRTESVVYFKFNKTLYMYSIIAATFLLSRYIFATFYKPEPVDVNFTPSVTIIIPCFNEETWIDRTIIGCTNQFYPPDKLEIIVVDDCSNDNSVARIKDTIERMQKEQGEELAERVHYFIQPVNKGKREALAVGAQMARGELIVFVDSDSFLDPFAIINVVQPFHDLKVGGVSGRTDVANTYTNSLTKMQAVRYYIAFRL